MEAKLKKEVIITSKLPDGTVIEMKDDIIFDDTPICYDEDGNKLFFPKNHFFSGCGFPEDLFDIIEPIDKK